MAAAASITPAVIRLRRGYYSVASRTTPGQSYEVHLLSEASSCTCPAGAHGRHCWHADAARETSALFARTYGTTPARPARLTLRTLPAPLSFVGYADRRRRLDELAVDLFG